MAQMMNVDCTFHPKLSSIAGLGAGGSGAVDDFHYSSGAAARGGNGPAEEHGRSKSAPRLRPGASSSPTTTTMVWGTKGLHGLEFANPAAQASPQSGGITLGEFSPKGYCMCHVLSRPRRGCHRAPWRAACGRPPRLGRYYQ